MNPTAIRLPLVLGVLAIVTLALFHANSQAPYPSRVDIDTIPAKDWEYRIVSVAAGLTTPKMEDMANKMAEGGWYLWQTSGDGDGGSRIVFRRIKKEA